MHPIAKVVIHALPKLFCFIGRKVRERRAARKEKQLLKEIRDEQMKAESVKAGIIATQREVEAAKSRARAAEKEFWRKP